ncbi:peptidoglycan-binding domain-containing protein [Paenibacillus glucanolyticus]|uniref:peptidoglycan-binding domain-containing protein n=1 Tax=Paenibacillus glucanolyticus TaxID=59843 RepID=UPI00128D92B0|nr:peptidoglycan-binding domain-containing protein [Paenibacillus glucanolyticus]MPY20061.1 peptidoglycan-binding protein [Paenibacillus glucanolyticus]
MKKKMKTILSLTLASVALVGSLGISGQAYADNDFRGWPTLRSGSTGGYVRALQSNLWAYGYQSTVGSVDGSFGSGVTSAVRAFQTKFGLTSDGVVGSGTWNRMSQNVVTEATDYIFYLDTPYSSTYWVNYYHPGANTSTLNYDLMYKGGNSTVNTGRVY